jgi:DNA-binding response OmpR family regulator
MDLHHSDLGVGVPRILLVDAAVDEREMYAVALRAQGYDVRESGDGEEALLETRIAAPDLIVADVVLPKIHGLQFLATLRADAATRDIPVIMLTGYDQPLSVVSEAKAAGATTVRIKPCLPATLVRDIEGIMQACRTLQQKAESVRQHALDTRARAAAAVAHAVDLAHRACPICAADLTPSGVIRTSVGHTYYRPCPNGCGLWYYDGPGRQMRKLI